MLFASFLLLLVLQGGSNVDVDPSKTMIWGPGLKPDKITMRARYVFLQLMDHEGKNLTTSPGPEFISTQIQGQTATGQPCHVWLQILDCKDGSFIIRYKFYNTCFDFKLTVKAKKHKLPVLVIHSKGPIYEDECDCPNPSMEDWLKHLECPLSYPRIERDLAPFSSVDFNEIRQSIIKRYDHAGSVSLCHYIVKSNRVFRTCYGQHVGFKIFMDATLLSMTRKVVLPDIEMFVNLGDWPLVPSKGKIYPIFSWCGSTDTKDVVMPTYDLTDASLEAMGRLMLDMLFIQGNIDTPWENKTEKMFWRGRDSCRERLDLIDISRKHPELFNVSITNFFFFKDEIEKYGPGQRHTSFLNFFKYKYQLNIDGVVAAYRFPFLLAGDGLVFKQDSKYYEFFYEDVLPGKHYVPVKIDLSDLVEKINWAKEHDEEAREITKAARQFARDNLLPRDVFCYHAVLFNEWSKRLKSKVKVLDNMEEVPQPKHSCKCYNSIAKPKEEL